MRELKFRGKRIDNGEWVYGSYHCAVGEASLHEHLYNGGYKKTPVTLNVHWIFQRELPQDRGWDVKDTYMPFKVIPESIGEFSGLTDNWKKEIWEGDTAKILYTDWPSKSNDDPRPLDQYLEDIAITGEIVFHQGYFCLMVDNLKFGCKDYLELNPGAHGFIKVTGNIYEQQTVTQ